MQRHDADVLALIAGMLLCVVGAAGLVLRPFDPELLRWVWPGLLVVVGLAVLLGSRPRNDTAKPAAPFARRANATDGPPLAEGQHPGGELRGGACPPSI